MPADVTDAMCQTCASGARCVEHGTNGAAREERAMTADVQRLRMDVGRARAALAEALREYGRRKAEADRAWAKVEAAQKELFDVGAKVADAIIRSGR